MATTTHQQVSTAPSLAGLNQTLTGKLALAFASHLEETRFMKVLNACIEMLSASNALAGLFATYKTDLESLGIR